MGWDGMGWVWGQLVGIELVYAERVRGGAEGSSVVSGGVRGLGFGGVGWERKWEMGV